MGLITLDTYNESNQNNTWGVTPAFSEDESGQSFSVPSSFSGVLESAQFYMNKTGVPTGNAQARLYDHDGGAFGSTGLPTGSALATSDPVDVASLTGSFVLRQFVFSGANRVQLTPGINYFIICQFAGGDASNFPALGYDSTSATHPGNIAYRTGAGAWSAWTAGNDICFYVFGSMTNKFVPKNNLRPAPFKPGLAR